MASDPGWARAQRKLLRMRDQDQHAMEAVVQVRAYMERETERGLVTMERARFGRQGAVDVVVQGRGAGGCRGD